MSAWLHWLENASLAMAVRDSIALTAALSAVHLVGFTIATGGALVTNLALVGALFPQRPLLDVVRVPLRGVWAGLAISIVSGGVLFSARASAASANGIFQIKMLLLVAAAVLHAALHAYVMRVPSPAPWTRRLAGAAGMVVWLGLAMAGCAFILLE